jgi:pimeloyl-ACP methyl ester carboxylesterase
MLSIWFVQQQAKYVSVVHEVLEKMGWAKSTIIGHSMSSGTAMLYAGAFPSNVEKLVMIDGFGPLTSPQTRAAGNLRKAIEKDVSQVIGKAPKLYPSLRVAVEARVRTVSTYPGKQYISHDAAKALVSRGVALKDTPTMEEPITEEEAGPIFFRHDGRLLNPSFSYFSSDQVTGSQLMILSTILFLIWMLTCQCVYR